MLFKRQCQRHRASSNFKRTPTFDIRYTNVIFVLSSQISENGDEKHWWWKSTKHGPRSDGWADEIETAGAFGALSHLHSQLAQLSANLSDTENLLRMTSVQAEAMRGLGSWHGALYVFLFFCPGLKVEQKGVSSSIDAMQIHGSES
ncbi:hypothetical protein MY4824_002118, partial [Beauveria thailandica]